MRLVCGELRVENLAFLGRHSVGGMTETPKLRGMANVSYWATDWAAAKTWYSELIGFEPYFQRDGGNSFGVMYNPHYVDIFAARG